MAPNKCFLKCLVFHEALGTLCVEIHFRILCEIRTRDGRVGCANDTSLQCHLIISCCSSALDTLAIMGNYTEFNRVYNLIAETRTDFDSNINVSVFETNIRIVGGLLSAHLLAKKGDTLKDLYCKSPASLIS